MRAMPEHRILVTGFEPFGGDSVNPAWLVAQHLSRASIAGVQVQAVQLPCVFGLSAQVLVQALAQHSPDVVLVLGLAQGRDGISIERVAINVDDARIPDNAGQQPIDTPVVPGGPAAYFSTLPIKRLAQGLPTHRWCQADLRLTSAPCPSSAWRKACNKLGTRCTSHKPRARLFATMFSTRYNTTCTVSV